MPPPIEQQRLDELARRLELIEAHLSRLDTYFRSFFLTHPICWGEGAIVFHEADVQERVPTPWWLKWAGEPKGGAAPAWRFLERRRHPWRRQLYVKGRNMTVRHLIGTAKANRWSEEEAASNLDLPAEAIREAFAYFERNQELLELEAAYERLLLAKKGGKRGPQAVS
jgi:uncharacterized protein (DUF433 family)